MAMSQQADTDEIRVLFAGANAEMYAGLASTIAGNSGVVLLDPATSAVGAADTAMSLRPKVVLLDLALGGAELVAEIREKAPDSKILVYSAITVDRIVRYLMHLGISGYVFENIEPRALLVAIRTVASGSTIFSDAILRR